jgi:hypothetical protein
MFSNQLRSNSSGALVAVAIVVLSFFGVGALMMRALAHGVTTSTGDRCELVCRPTAQGDKG